MLDPVTAISGGGPAYVFLLTELMEQAGLDQGLPPELARQLWPARRSSAPAALLAAVGGGRRRSAHCRHLARSGTPSVRWQCCVRMTPGRNPSPQAIQAATERSRELSG